MDPAWRERYGARVDAYRLPTQEQKRRGLAQQIATDGYRLLESVLAPSAPVWLREVPAVKVLRTVWVQQFTRTVSGGDEEVARRGPDDLPPSGILVASPYDPQARYAKKRGSAWIGYKIHLSESCDDPEESKRPHLITHVATTEATVNDAMVVEEVHDRLDDKDLLPREHLLDAGYTSAELLVTAPRIRGVHIVGPVRSNNTRQAAPGGSYAKSAFTIDWQAKQAICPTGATSRYWTQGLDNNGREAIRIRFATATCAPCPVRDQCTRSTQFGRQLTVRPQQQDAALERVRAEQSTDQWQQRYAARAGVEGTMHQAVTIAGVRRTRYLGLAKTHLAHILTAAALNLVRLDAWWNEAPGSDPHLSHNGAGSRSLSAIGQQGHRGVLQPVATPLGQRPDQPRRV